MAGVIIRVSFSSAEEVRRARGELNDALQSQPVDAEELTRVVWELWTNQRHDRIGRTAEGTVTIMLDCVVVALPGAPFDPIVASKREGARGLDTTGWRLARIGWTWTFGYDDGENRITLRQV